MPDAVGRFFDAVAEDYDELEPWYEYLYERLHAILRAELVPPPDGRHRRALDVGCGNGFQAEVLAELGYETHGVDVSPGLLARARRRVPGARLVLGSAEALPYADASFDAVSSGGSTLSLLAAPARALDEMGRVLRPGGRLLVECEHRWSLDLGWALVSAASGDRLGYGLSLGQAWRQLRGPASDGCVIEYPYPLADGSAASLRLRLFTRSQLQRMLMEAGLAPQRIWGLHSATNLIPSTVLHRPRLGRRLTALYRRLCALDTAVATRPLGRALANSLVVLAVKPGGAGVVGR